MNESACCSRSLPIFGIVSVLGFVHSNKCVVLSRCFNLYFLDDIWFEESCHKLICHVYFFAEFIFKGFGPFLFPIGLFSYCWIWIVLCILWLRVLVTWAFCKDFLQVYGLSFQSSDVAFHQENHFKLYCHLYYQSFLS